MARGGSLRQEQCTSFSFLVSPLLRSRGSELNRGSRGMWEGHASEVHKRKGDIRMGHMLARVIYATHMPARHILGRRWAHGLEEDTTRYI